MFVVAVVRRQTTEPGVHPRDVCVVVVRVSRVQSYITPVVQRVGVGGGRHDARRRVGDDASTGRDATRLPLSRRQRRQSFLRRSDHRSAEGRRSRLTRVGFRLNEWLFASLKLELIAYT